MRRIGVRELRQNASKYLRLAQAGETIEVTDRNVPVALLTPLPKKPKTRYEEMIEQGLLIPAKRDWRTLGPPIEAPGRPLSDVLQEMRDEDDR
jgi:prevent-host-death family protein